MNLRLPALLRQVVFTFCVSFLLLTLASAARAQNGDVAVSKTTTSTIVPADTDVVFDLIVSNTSPQVAPGPTTLTDAVPTNMTFVAAAFPEGWSCMLPAAGSGGAITCTYAGDMPADETVFSFTFIFHINPGVPNDTVITNTASITNGSDLNSENNSSSASVTVGEPPPPPPPPLGPRDVLISEFRLSGPGGDGDEYIELFCNRDSDCDLTGVVLRAHDPTVPPEIEGGPPGAEFTLAFPPGIIIPARQFLLIANSDGYSLFGYSLPDVDVSGDATFFDNEGFQLAYTGDEPAVLDSVGFAGGGNSGLYVEGTALQRATGPRPPDQYAYVRKRTLTTAGRPQDTDDNFSDFVLVSVTGNEHAGIVSPVLGAPGPKSTFSPRTYSNSDVSASLVEPGVSREASPNRVRTGSGNSGTLSIRRSFTNNTGAPFSYVGFRVIEISTLNLGAEADLRLITSPNAESFNNSQGRPVNILGTNLEYDAGCGCEPEQPNGGGLNSSASTNLGQVVVDPGGTIDVQFLFNVIRAGSFRYYLYVEAFQIEEEGGKGPANAAPLIPASRIRPATAPARKFIDIRRGIRLLSNKAPRPQKRPELKEGGGSTQITPPRTVAPQFTPFVIINRESLAEPKPVRRKTRVRRKSSKALKLKAATEDKTTEANQAEKPQN